MVRISRIAIRPILVLQVTDFFSSSLEKGEERERERKRGRQRLTLDKLNSANDHLTIINLTFEDFLNRCIRSKNECNSYASQKPSEYGVMKCAGF